MNIATELRAKPLPPPLQRKYPRATIDVDVSVEGDHAFFAGVARDISEGGLFVATHVPLPIGTLVALTFTLAGRSKVQVIASVRWQRMYEEASEAPPGMGLEFVGLEEPALQVIRAFLAGRAPLLWE